MTPALAGQALRKIAITTAITALLADGLYTWRYWLVLGRNERRTKPYAELRYFAIIGQLSVETAIILHLWSTLKQAEDQQTQPGELRAVA